LTLLDASDGVCQGVLASAYAVVRKGLSHADWKGRLAAAHGALRAITAAQLAMKGVLRREAPAEAVLRAVVTSHEAPALEQALAEHPGGRAPFGKAYDGRRTDVETALTAHTSGGLGQKSSLPGSIGKALLSPDCMTSHGLLSAYTRTIADGWKAVSELHHPARVRPDSRREARSWVPVPVLRQHRTGGVREVAGPAAVQRSAPTGQAQGRPRPVTRRQRFSTGWGNLNDHDWGTFGDP